MLVRETGGGDGPKSEHGYRVVPLPDVVIAALRAWRKAQLAERLAWGEAWTDTGRVFTREDGTAVPGQWASVRFETLAYRAGLPPVRFHDLRHGAASQLKASGADTKLISAILGHSRTSFTDATYVTVFPDVAAAAMDQAAAVVGRAQEGNDERILVGWPSLPELDAYGCYADEYSPVHDGMLPARDRSPDSCSCLDECNCTCPDCDCGTISWCPMGGICTCPDGCGPCG